jgi:hypothetical protein
MKFAFAILLIFFITTSATSQVKEYPFYQLYQLDSIGNTQSVCKHFGELYFNFLQLVEQKLEKEDSATQKLVRHFETVFAQFYIDACVAYKNNAKAPLTAWQPYFIDSTLQFYQYYLLGTNAHLNGGLAEAIGGSYTPEQWKWIKKKYYLFNSCLNKTYRYVYAETMNNNKKAQTLHKMTFGLDRLVGYYLLYKWRKRQMRLMKYYFARSPHYQKLLDKVNRKKATIDDLVTTLLRVPYVPPSKLKRIEQPALAAGTAQ